MARHTTKVNGVDVTTYLGNQRLKGLYNKIPMTQKQVLEYARCAEDPIYFIEKYVKVISLDKGYIPFTLRPYQHRVINTINSNRYTIIRQGRQSGKTVTVGAWLLWYILFNDTKNCCIIANKASLARSHLDKIKKSYEGLPLWMQQGVKTWNKGNIELENGSAIIAAATSSSSIRGETMNVVYLDEWAFVHPNMQEEFMTSTYPVITSGTESKIIVTSTPNGMEMYYKMWMDAVEGRSKYAYVDVHWKEVPGRDDNWAKEFIANTSQRQFNQEICCEFLGSAHTLIESHKLRSMVWKNPVWEDAEGKTKIYKSPVAGNSYAITVDCSEGVGYDYSVIDVFDCSKLPYEQVAIYRCNMTSPQVLPEIIYKLGKTYNDALVLIELGGGTLGIGNDVANILYGELEYDNMAVISASEKKGQVMNGGFGGKVQYGIKMTPAVKASGCSTLKNLIETDKLVINDYTTFSELTTFIMTSKSWASEPNKHDDTTMTLVHFSWMLNQPYFNEVMNIDDGLRKRLYEEKLKRIEQELTPVGFFVTGNPEVDGVEYMVEGGEIWQKA